MEEDPRYFPVKSKLLQKPTVQNQLTELKKVVDKAEERISYESAHNPDILRALSVIESFLKKSKRVCYGGTAINAILPDTLKFYDSTKDLPDYDFFTPDPDADIKVILEDLKKEGFTDVIQRVGMHEGTFKILVNFMPLADVSYLDPTLYKVLEKRSIVKQKVHYADEDFLRMGMYLELSRPRGDVSRWEKVFERLTLLNTAFPPKPCKASLDQVVGRVHIPSIIRQKIYEFILEKKRISVGADAILYYDTRMNKKSFQKPALSWFTHQNGMMVIYSSEAIRDGIELQSLLGTEFITLETKSAMGELIPERVVLSYRNMPLVMILQESACHSFVPVDLRDKRVLYLGSLDTLLTLYLAFDIFKQEEETLQFLLSCLCSKLIELSSFFRSQKDIPPFPIDCTGYQKGYTTLLKEKYSRIQRQKKKRATVKRQLTVKNTTRKV
jgi:hypothetical protein